LRSSLQYLLLLATSQCPVLSCQELSSRSELGSGAEIASNLMQVVGSVLLLSPGILKNNLIYLCQIVVTFCGYCTESSLILLGFGKEFIT
jgi:UPF0716 family protein affecting phage T7 exclusion